MTEWALLALAALNLLLLLWLALRRGNEQAEQARHEALQLALRHDGERVERELRAEVQDSARGTRQELAQALSLFQQGLLTQQGDVARTQNEQIDTLRTQLAAMQERVGQSLQGTTQALGQQSLATQESLAGGLLRAREAQDDALRRFAESFGEQIRALAQGNERALETLRATVEQRLQAIQADNERKLEAMRATVDEKLHATLEQRLGESFRQVAERLDLVHRGLGEMQNLARDVGSLSRTLNNVKTRGTFGEVQLAGLLEQVFTPEQYGAGVETVPGSNARVDFAIRLPGRREDGLPMWLPIDAKFPREDYERLLDAQESADPAGVEAAAKAIEARLKLEARSIRDKYVAPPHTTDFAILFLPTEGLYAEALRRPGLVDALQRDCRITVAGPTTLLATLTSLQMGFRTLALEKRSAEVWEVLGAVKTEFAKFGEVLARTKKKLDEASRTIDAAEVRTRAMARSLRGVEALPEQRAQALLPGSVLDDEAEARV